MLTRPSESFRRTACGSNPAPSSTTRSTISPRPYVSSTVRAFRAAVFHHVVQRFLGDPVQADRQVSFDRSRQARHLEADIDLPRLGEPFAESADRALESQLFEPRGMQLMGEAVQRGANVVRPIRQLRHLLLDMRRRVRELVPEHAELGAEEREALPDIVVKLSRQTGTLVFGGTDQTRTQVEQLALEGGTVLFRRFVEVPRPIVVHPNPSLKRDTASFVKRNSGLDRTYISYIVCILTCTVR